MESENIILKYLIATLWIFFQLEQIKGVYRTVSLVKYKHVSNKIMFLQ